MPAFEWKDLYSVGNDIIDGQHRQLFDIANHYCEVYNTGAGTSALGSVFNDLVDYTAMHFADEERMLQEAGYPDFHNHKQNHDKLVGLVTNYQQRFAEGADGIAEQAMHFIKTWLNGHILGMDKQYRTYL